MQLLYAVPVDEFLIVERKTSSYMHGEGCISVSLTRKKCRRNIFFSFLRSRKCGII